MVDRRYLVVDSLPPVLHLTRTAWLEMVGHAYDGLPDEACGLLAGPPGTERVTAFYPCRNAAGSAKLYAIDYPEIEAASDDAEVKGLELKGTMHSHTHTDAYPSPTDIDAADPVWTYIIVSLRAEAPVLRAFKIRDSVRELQVSLLGDQ
jgi:proteasome lid subunit RPN8/RPN11